MKKTSITFLVLVMFVFTIFSSVFSSKSLASTTFPDLTELEEAKIGDVLATEIMQGDDKGKFRPNAYLTKAEATTIVLKMDGYYNSYLSAPSTFDDVPVMHWASQSIGLASSLGLVEGNEYNCFEPDRNVNAAEFITMCLRVIGVGELLDSTGRWPYAHMEFCQNEKILTKLTTSVYQPLTRLEAANIVSQFLSTNTWERNYITGLYEKTDTNIMAKNLSIDFYKEAIVSSVNEDDYEIDILTKDIDGNYSESIEYLPCNKVIKLENLEVGDFANVYVKNNKVIKVDILQDLDTRIIDYDGFLEFNYTNEYVRLKVNNKSKKYYLNTDLLTVTANGTTKTGSQNSLSSVKRLILSTLEGYYDEDDDEYEVNVSGRAILDANDKIISLQMTAFEKIIQVKSVSGEKITGYANISSGSSTNTTQLRTDSGVRTTSLNLNNKDYTIKDPKGKTIDIDDLAQGDVLLYSSTSPYNLQLVENIVTGKASTVYHGDEDEEDHETDYMSQYITISGQDYYRNTQFFGKANLPSQGKRVTLYLDSSDNIIGWKYAK